MAKQIIHRLIDDIDGTEANQTVEFALDGAAYTIDLSDEHATELRSALAAFIAAGTRLGGRRTGAPAAREGRRDRDYLTKVRTWARSAGYDISDRGRIPQNVIDEYDAKH